MQLETITLQNFRCFAQQTIPISARVVLIEGDNGAGKTSLLEALYYSCYLRSFRTHLGRELVSFDMNHFFIKVAFDHTRLHSQHQIQVGLSAGTKLVKFDQKAVQSHKEIVQHYRAVALTEDDLSFIKDGPEGRRLFLDQALALEQPELIPHMKEYKRIVQSRNALLARHVKPHAQELCSWTEQLWQAAVQLQKHRKAYLAQLEEKVAQLLVDNKEVLGDAMSLKLVYEPKNMHSIRDFDAFLLTHEQKGADALEARYGRSLFGAHLDDISILFNDKKARMFASRGQQKRALFVIKVAQILLLEEQGKAAMLLLDDFLTDFDEMHLDWCLKLLTQLRSQIIIACPLKSYLGEKLYRLFDVQTITL